MRPMTSANINNKLRRGLQKKVRVSKGKKQSFGCTQWERTWLECNDCEGRMRAEVSRLCARERTRVRRVHPRGNCNSSEPEQALRREMLIRGRVKSARLCQMHEVKGGNKKLTNTEAVITTDFTRRQGSIKRQAQTTARLMAL